MALITLDIPPGVVRNGTDLEQTGRWRDASLIRWRNQSLRPVGGWNTRKAAAATQPPRGAVTWIDNSDTIRYAFGTADGLFTALDSNIIVDITPSGLTSGNVDAVENLGYGGNFYGSEYYGTERVAGAPTECTTWSLDNFGEDLVACSSDDGDLLRWELDSATDAATVSGAPTSNTSILVTEERFVFCLGAGGNPRKVQWCDREDITTWTPAATNEAGDIQLQTSGKIMQGIRMRGRALIITSVDAHVATYSGPPFVYGFERAGTACGAISRLGAVAVDEGAFWMGSKSFFLYNGSSVQELPCDVADYVFDDINNAQQSKICAVHNSQYSEVWWFYPSKSSTENDRYVSYNYKGNYWMIGALARTAAVDKGVFRHPMWFDPDANIFDHEINQSHEGNDIFVESGPIYIGEGDQVARVTQLIPDEKTQGEVTATFKTRFYPNASETLHGPFTMANPTSVRFTGRQVRMRLTGSDLVDFRVGNMRLDVSPGGRR